MNPTKLQLECNWGLHKRLSPERMGTDIGCWDFGPSYSRPLREVSPRWLPLLLKRKTEKNLLTEDDKAFLDI